MMTTMKNSPCTRMMLCGLLCLASCVVTDVGNPPDKPPISSALQFELTTDADSPAFSLDRGLLSFKRVRLIEASDCTPDAAVDVPLPDPFEVLSWKQPSQPLLVKEENTEFCRIGMLFEPLTAARRPENAPAEALGASLVLQGEIPDSEGSRVLIALDITQKLQLDAVQASFTLDDPERVHELLISFDTRTWFTAESLRMADRDAEGNVLISADSNTALYDTIVQGLAKDVSIFYDRNNNGSFDDDERLDPIAKGGVVDP